MDSLELLLLAIEEYIEALKKKLDDASFDGGVYGNIYIRYNFSFDEKEAKECEAIIESVTGNWTWTTNTPIILTGSTATVNFVSEREITLFESSTTTGEEW